MKIAVCVKAVPDAAAGRRIAEGSKRLDRSGELALSDFDSHAVEEALRVKEAAGEGEVVAVSDAINEPRYPSLKGIMGAKAKPQATLSAADVGGAAESRTVVLALAPPPPRGESRRVDDGSTTDAAEAILAFLAEKRVL